MYYRVYVCACMCVRERFSENIVNFFLSVNLSTKRSINIFTKYYLLKRSFIFIDVYWAYKVFAEKISISHTVVRYWQLSIDTARNLSLRSNTYISCFTHCSYLPFIYARSDTHYDLLLPHLFYRREIIFV